jgi:hypothetical protein
MAIDIKDLETLRAESQQLGARITRLSIILISVLTVVTFTITNALEKVDVSELKYELDRAKQSTETYWNIYQDKLSELSNSPSTANLEEEEKRKDSLRDLWSTASDKQSEIQRRYDTLLTESFSISPSLLGSGLKIDLRVWIYSIPFIVLVATIYIQILRKKQKTLSVVAASQVSSNTEVTNIVRLAFSEHPDVETPYAKSPSQLEQAIYLLITAFLLTHIIVALSATELVLLGLSFTVSLQYLLMFLTVSFYGISYYYYIVVSLDRQSAALTGWPAEPSLAIKSWRKLQALTQRRILKLKTKRSLTIGSLLVLSSLFLSTSASCNQDAQLVRLPGYKLLQEPGGKLWRLQQIDPNLELLERLVREPNLPQETIDKSLQEAQDRLLQEPKGGWWISTVVKPKVETLYWQNSINNLGRYAYALSLVLAALTLLVVLFFAVRYKGAGLNKVCTFLFLLSMTLALIIITDFSFNTFWFKDELFILSNLFWLVPIGFLCRRIFLYRGEADAQWAINKSFLVILLLPIAVSAMVYVCYVAVYRFVGVLVYFVGLNLLALTYLKIVRDELRNKRLALKASPEESSLR